MCHALDSNIRFDIRYATWERECNSIDDADEGGDCDCGLNDVIIAALKHARTWPPIRRRSGSVCIPCRLDHIQLSSANIHPRRTHTLFHFSIHSSIPSPPFSLSPIHSPNLIFSRWAS